MAPTLPYMHSPRGHCAAAAITISSSSGSDQSVINTLVILSSATFSGSVDIVPDSYASLGSDEARGGQRSAPRYRRPPSPASSVVPVRSPTVITAASFANGSGAQATSRRMAAPPHQCPSVRSVLPVRAPGGGDDEATSRPKRKARYRLWDIDDELKILTTVAEHYRDKGKPPKASVLLEKICADGGLCRCSVDARELSDKVYKLRKKFEKAAAKAAAKGGRCLRKFCKQGLFEISMELWSHRLPVDVVAALLVQGGQN